MFDHNNEICIRAAEPKDAQTIYDWENDTSIWRVSETYMPYTHQQVEQFIINSDIFANRQIRIMIEEIQSHKAVGCIDLFDFDPLNLRIEIGVLIRENFRHKGYAHEAITMAVRYCFDFLMVKQVYCAIDVTNDESIRLFEQMGFVKCGCRKNWLRTPDGYHDEVELQLFNTNFK